VNRPRAAGDAALLVPASVWPAPASTRPARPATGLATAIRVARLPGVLDVVPGAQTVLVRVEPGSWDLDELTAAVLALAEAGQPGRAAEPVAGSGGLLEIPVCYDGADLAGVAALTGLSVSAVIASHQAAEYQVGWLGFMPGFGYLTGLDPLLAAVPRLATPRLTVPAGSVAIAGGLTAVYPAASPGGWQLLGRTDIGLWDTGRQQPAVLEPGMRVRFRAVDQLTVPHSHDLEGWSSDQALRLPDDGARSVEVLRSGPLATVQDLGRPGLAHLGVPPSGAADQASLRLANLLVGNTEDAAGLEITLGGAVLRFSDTVVIAVAGAPAVLELQPGQPAAGPSAERASAPPAGLRHGAACRVPAGSVLRLSSAGSGLRSYLAIAGGIDIPPALGSRATDLHACLGLRPLRAGDRLPVGDPAGIRLDLDGGAAGGGLADGDDLDRLRTPVPVQGQVAVLRALAGPRDDWLGPAALDVMAGSDYLVSTASNRTGLRLSGATLPAAGRSELPSEGIVTGSIQVPPDGQPIVLLADHPTTAGYPVIAVLRSADVGIAAQLRPGQRVRFQLTSAATG
jgi:KipI family sensor histidine kinase inhibitor